MRSVPNLKTMTVFSSVAMLDLGVNIDGQLTMADHVAALFQVGNSNYATDGHTFANFGGRDDTGTSSRLDYWNSLLYGISDGLLTKLQTVQNAAGRS